MKTRTPPAPASPPEEPAVQLILEDGAPLETSWHRTQINLSIESADERFRRRRRRRYFAGGNMFVYYGVEQAQAVREEVEAELAGQAPEKKAFRGPDFFCVLDVDDRRVRKAWVVWNEGGRYPDFILELLSASTRGVDLGVKKDLYERTFRTPEYLCYDPERDELLGWRLENGVYRPMEPDDDGRFRSDVLECTVGRWQGTYQRQEATWIRLFDAQGNPYPVGEESAEVQRRRAEAEHERAEAERERAEAERRRAAALEEENERLRARLRDLEGTG